MALSRRTVFFIQNKVGLPDKTESPMSPINEIKSLVAESRTSDALSRLLELSQSNKRVHDAVHIVLGEFNDLTSQRLTALPKNNLNH